MGLVQVIAEIAGGKDNRTRIESAIKLELDAVLTRHHSLSAQITQSPVESGNYIADNINLEPIVFTMEGFVSDDPVTSLVEAAIAGVMSGSAASLPGVGNIGAQFGVSDTRSKTAYDALKKIYEKKTVVTVVTRLTSYENMILEKLDIPESANIGYAIQFTATFRQVQFVTLMKARVNAGATSALGSAAAQAANLGKQAASVAATAQKSSVLFGALKGLGMM